MSNQNFVEWILNGREERNLEYKGNIKWESAKIKAKLTKTILGMSNIKDGGTIVIGVEKSGESYIPSGLSQENFNSYKQDDISSYVNEYADPYVEINVNKVAHEQNNFVIIQIMEFTELPVICKKDGEEGLFRGDIYTRPRRKIETVKIPSQVEMREIIEMATEKTSIQFQTRLKKLGFTVVTTEDRSEQSFNEQLGAL